VVLQKARAEGPDGGGAVAPRAAGAQVPPRQPSWARARDASRSSRPSARWLPPPPRCSCSARAAPARSSSPRPSTAQPRRSRPFVKVGAPRCPRPCSRGELFGHEKGSFTGAVYTRAGRFEAADGGTLLPRRDRRHHAHRSGQAAALPGGAGVRARGREQDLKVDVRIVAATHRDLKKRLEEAASGRTSSTA